MSKTFANWPPSLSDAQKAELVQQAIDWSTAHGLLLRTGTGADAVHVPFALFPSPFPRLAFQQVTGAMQLSLNRLVHRISLDHQFLESIFEKYSG
jgi:glutathione synthase